VDWYILQSLSGQEKRIATLIVDKAKKDGLGECIAEIVVPTEKVMEMHKGKKISMDKKFLPGYILLNVDMKDELWHLIANIPKVGRFLGMGGKPQKVPKAEIDKIMSQIQANVIEREKKSLFVVGDSVKVNEGPFESFTGTVEDVDQDKQKLKVSVVIFSRATPLELSFTQVTKVNV
jgi:transcriptional antiterminator NusG